MALKLFRQGYLKVEAPHFWAENYYAAADAIARIEGRTVYLSLDRQGLDAQQ
ncbi:hypothetical protein [Arthrobacter sp. SLBN-83]|uniref:hypothetical protein n=1 Tax=Arthrobacter sp. SLBN-83 TaxID=2768449 RepID=UPI00135BA173|nr:hypothetical protein [Arthrobacter sp. SLBN-83]